MPSNYDQIRAENIEDYGKKTSYVNLFSQLYSQRAHFVLEILQNAEDAGATKINFRVFEDRLEIRHDGRPFNEQDVRGVCGLGEGTKIEDLTAIGRFGIGFKSIYAYTKSPAIHSGDEHFRIQDYVRPYGIVAPVDEDENETLFILPFDHSEKSPERAYWEISHYLSTLDPKTILFLNTLQEVSWASGERTGTLLREVTPCDFGRQITILSDGKEDATEWLVFERSVDLGEAGHPPVEVAYQLAEDGKGVCGVKSSPLVAFFPTEKNSHLGFLIQGPYRTTPARDNVPAYDEVNQKLMAETATLVVDTLRHFRDQNMITVDFLNIMPIRSADFPTQNMFRPIFDAVATALREEPLLPALGGGYIRGRDARLADGAPLRQLLSNEQLQALYETDGKIAWLSEEIGENRTPDLWKFLSYNLGIRTVDGEDFARQIELPFIEAQTDEWMIEFYKYLRDREALWQTKRSGRNNWRSEGPLRNKPFIRLQDDSHTQPFSDMGHPKAWLPSDEYSSFTTIKSEIAANEEVHKFFEELGFHTPDITDYIIRNILPLYDDPKASNIDEAKHLEHMRILMKWKQKPGQAGHSDKEKLRFAAIFRSNIDLKYHVGYKCYIDTPLSETDLRHIYSLHAPGIPSKTPLWDGYSELLEEGFADFAVFCGVKDSLAIEHTSYYKHPQAEKMRAVHGNARYVTKTATNDDHIILNLTEFLALQKVGINLLVWNTLSRADAEVLHACYAPNAQCEIIPYKSSLVLMLADAEWIPDKNGNFLKPCDMTKELLHPNFRYDNRNGWLDEIGFGETAKQETEEYKQFEQFAKRMGMPPKLAAELQDLPDAERNEVFEGLRKSIAKQKAARNRQQEQTIPFAEELGEALSTPGTSTSDDADHLDDIDPSRGSAPNPSRRRDKIAKQIAADIEHENDLAPQFTIESRRKWASKNDGVRRALTEWYNGKCQICGKTFKKADGENYFEAVYLVDRKEAEWHDRAGNTLCLCPWHSAMFMYGEKDAERVIDQVMGLKLQAEGGDGDLALNMQLCSEQVAIKYAEKHLLDLQEMIKASEHATSADVEAIPSAE